MICGLVVRLGGILSTVETRHALSLQGGVIAKRRRVIAKRRRMIPKRRRVIPMSGQVMRRGGILYRWARDSALFFWVIGGFDSGGAFGNWGWLC